MARRYNLSRHYDEFQLSSVLFNGTISECISYLERNGGKVRDYLLDASINSYRLWVDTEPRGVSYDACWDCPLR